jgi:hypothetical protein
MTKNMAFICMDRRRQDPQEWNQDLALMFPGAETNVNRSTCDVLRQELLPVISVDNTSCPQQLASEYLRFALQDAGLALGPVYCSHFIALASLEANT